MEKVKIALYKKNPDTGILENLLGNYALENVELIDTIYGIEYGEKTKVHLFITVDREIADWEFDAIYDYYNADSMRELVISVEEKEDCYNPTWLLVFDFEDNNEKMEKKINQILLHHKTELENVYTEIMDKKTEYE